MRVWCGRDGVRGVEREERSDSLRLGYENLGRMREREEKGPDIMGEGVRELDGATGQ